MTVSHWELEQWIKAAEVVFLLITAAVYLHALATGLIRLRRVRRAIPAFQRQLIIGRAVRHTAVLWFIAGAVHALIARFHENVTFRSVAWILGATCAFTAWAILDRHRWEARIDAMGGPR